MENKDINKITGNTLIELGYKPGKWFSDAIEYANENCLNGEDLDIYLESVCPPIIEHIEPFENPITYHKNIRAENEEETSNVNAVFDTMDILMKTPTLINGSVMPDACPTGRDAPWRKKKRRKENRRNKR